MMAGRTSYLVVRQLGSLLCGVVRHGLEAGKPRSRRSDWTINL